VEVRALRDEHAFCATEGGALPGAVALRGEPASAQGRGARDAYDGLAVIVERDERGPHGDVAHIVICAVHRVDDPLPRRAALGPELLAIDRVLAPLALEDFAHHLLGAAIHGGDGGLVRLELDLEQFRGEVREGELVHLVRDAHGEFEVVRIGPGWLHASRVVGAWPTLGLGERGTCRPQARGLGELSTFGYGVVTVGGAWEISGFFVRPPLLTGPMTFSLADLDASAAALREFADADLTGL